MEYYAALKKEEEEERMKSSLCTEMEQFPEHSTKWKKSNAKKLSTVHYPSGKKEAVVKKRDMYEYLLIYLFLCSEKKMQEG